MRRPNDMTVTNTVAAVTQLAVTGDVIPATWYHTIRLPNGKLDAYAILFLADFVYWHRAQEVRDPQTGQFLRFERRFFGDKYQRNYADIASKFDVSVDTAKDVMHRLMQLGVITLELRTVFIAGQGAVPNVPYWDIDAEILTRLTYPDNAFAANIVATNTQGVGVSRPPTPITTKVEVGVSEGVTVGPSWGVTVGARGGVTNTEITTKNTTDKKEDPKPLFQDNSKSNSNGQLPLANGNFSPASIASLPEEEIPTGMYMPGIADPRKQPRKGMVARIDSYREDWSKMGFTEKTWQAYVDVLSQVTGLKPLIDVSNDDKELNQVRETAIILIRLGYSNLDQLKDLLNAYRKENAWKQGAPTLNAIKTFASARFAAKENAPQKVVVELAFGEGDDIQWARTAFTREKYEKEVVALRVKHRVISGLD